MDSKKICFILCVEDENKGQECENHIRELKVPFGYEVEVLMVQDAASPAAGYNEAMAASDAKYKIYMRPDVRIVNKYFLFEILLLFLDNSDIGMIGVKAGGETEERTDLVRERSGGDDGNPVEEEYREVLAPDGILLATQYDVPWREDLNGSFGDSGWFQSVEFWKSGYRVVIPHMKNPWCIGGEEDFQKDAEEIFECEYGDYARKWRRAHEKKKTVNERKFAFILCSNEPVFYEECVRYIRDLEIPFGYETEILCVEDAVSMAQGYNTCMKASDAKYKIYLHQDTFLIDGAMLETVLEIFRDPSVGMIGTVGAAKLPKDAMCCNAWELGGMFMQVRMTTQQIRNFAGADGESPAVPVAAVNGALLVTQYDVPWREDIFDGWSFYDISQALEMKRRGYKVVIPARPALWCYHDCAPADMRSYDKYRMRAIEEYPEVFSGRPRREELNKNREFSDKQKQLSDTVIGFWTQGQWEKLVEFSEAFGGAYPDDRDIQCILFLMEIYREEAGNGKTHSDIFRMRDWKKAYRYFKQYCFALRRLQTDPADSRKRGILEKMRGGEITPEFVKAVIRSAATNHSAVYSFLMGK